LLSPPFTYAQGGLDGYESVSLEDITVYFLPEQKNLAEILLKMSKEAKNLAQNRSGLKAKGDVRIIFCKDEKEFYAKSSVRQENIYACAVHIDNAIYINGAAFRKSPVNLREVLVHEFAHLLIGSNIKAPLPRWLEEGLAMHIAAESRFGDSLKLAYARFFGKTIPLREISLNFPQDQHLLNLAYAQGYSVVSFLLQMKKTSLKDLLSGLARNGTELYWDSLFVKNVEVQWVKWLGSKWRNVILIVTSSTIFWLGISFLFILAYTKKRRRAKLKIDQWQDEEDDI